MSAYDDARRAATALVDALGVVAVDAAVVLGSGLGAYAVERAEGDSVPYSRLPGFPATGAVGHAGTASVTTAGEHTVLLLSGRGHVYEGHDPASVTLPVRAAILAGARTVVLTNAAGGIAEGLAPGHLAVISDHLDMTGRNPLVGPNDERLGPRFPDMTDVYTPALRRLAREVAEEGGETLPEVVYAWWLGPSFETPAEIRMLRALGADVVGMSTVPEAIAARHMGSAILGISLVTNRAAGLSDAPLSSEEVIEIAHRVRPRVEAFLDRLLARPELVGSGP